ncbi:MAG TPA: LodA/GoxA family CTQ-dependent oxidase [Allosphingosinicella sp.]
MPKAAEIVEVAVYPPIGVARVGNAPGKDDYFLASEVRGQAPSDPTGFRDGEGRIKRQGVRFRVYARLTDGSIVELVQGKNVSIAWNVRVANLKAGWYQFLQAMDVSPGLPAGAGPRNAATGDRAQLDIVPSPVTIAGANLSGPKYEFADGAFFGKKVYLGECRTDAQGRLIFLGGRGLSEPQKAGSKPTTFANNDGWHDDTCDGPVHALVTVDGKSFDALPGYVIATPPNFAPGIFGVLTMEDVVLQTFQDAGWTAPATTTSFTRDIWPVFDRMTGMQWVDHGLYVAHGTGSTLDAGADARLNRLRDMSGGNKAWRKRVAALFRDPHDDGDYKPLKIPQLYGDAYNGPPVESALAGLSVTPILYAHIQRWANGDAVDDWKGVPKLPSFDKLEPAEQVAQLERAGLYECLGGPFHPGIELTWIMRRASLWAKPYRLRVAPVGEVARQDYGVALTPELCLSDQGPLTVAAAGSLTRWMGVPWQTDEASCNSDSDYSPSSYLSMPSFWGPRVPDQVLSSQSYGRLIDPAVTDLQALKYYGYREDWLRDVRGRNYAERINNMVSEWWMLGMAMPREVPARLQKLGLPSTVHIETGRHAASPGDNPKVKLVEMIDRLDVTPKTAGKSLVAAVEKSDFEPPKRMFRRGEV